MEKVRKDSVVNSGSNKNWYNGVYCIHVIHPSEKITLAYCQECLSNTDSMVEVDGTLREGTNKIGFCVGIAACCILCSTTGWAI